MPGAWETAEMTDYAVPPGDTIRECIEYIGVSVPSLAHRLELSRRDTYRLLDGELRITPRIAERLERAIGPEPSFWLNYDRLYIEARNGG